METTNYTLYIDDSGTKEYDSSGQYSTSGNTRYFVFGAVLLNSIESGKLSFNLNILKNHLFKTDMIEIKSNWLRIPKERNKRYLIPYQISDAQLTRFCNSIYDLLDELDIAFFAVVIDKLKMQENHSDLLSPVKIAYELLIKKVVEYCPVGSQLSVVVDDMYGGTAKGFSYKETITTIHNQLGTLEDIYTILRGIKFLNSAYYNQIQIADIVAYNIFRHFRDYGDLWENNDDLTWLPVPIYEWFNRIYPKFNQRFDGTLENHRIIVYPL